MNINLIAVHYAEQQKKNIIAFRLLDADSGQVMDQPYNSVYNVLNSNKVLIKGLKLDKTDNKIKGSNGTLERYPGIVNGKLLNNSLIILYSLDDKGYIVSNFEGKTTSALNKDVVTFANKVGIANGKVVTKDNKQFISAINGVYDNKPASQDKRINRSDIDKNYSDIAKKEIKQINMSRDNRYARVITGLPNPNSRLKEIDESTGLTVDQKMVFTMKAMQMTRPFYYSIYRTLNRVEAHPGDGINTMAVSLDTLYFNADFIKETSLPDLLFIFIHEICHIAMRHRSREKGREHDIWNQACDYYINKAIADEFGLVNPGDIVDAKTKLRTNENSKAYMISLPTNGLFNSNVDINTDTPESLYEELKKKADEQDESDNESGDSGSQDNNNQQDNSSSQSQSGSSNGNNQSDSNNSNQSNENQESKSEQDSQNNQESQSGQVGNSQGEGGESSGYDDCNESELEKLSQGKLGNQDNNNKINEDNNSNNDESYDDSNSKQQNKQDDSKNKQGRLVGKEFRGQKIKEHQDDIVDDNKSKGLSSEQIEQIQKSILNRAVTLHKQTNKFGGDTADFLERIVEEALAPKVDWRKVLKNKLTKATQKVNTFSAPDKRFRSRNMIMPGPKSLDNDALENIKVCIDTSGSISPEDLGVAFSQIKQLFNNYKAEAEVLYWDTRVRAVYPFNNIKELLSKKPMGGGGTNANCIFNYFETERDYKIGKKKKPSIIIVFTDGYFGHIENKYKKYKDVIWIIKDNNDFKAPFGTTAPLKINE